MHKTLDQLREGDVIVMWKLDRLLRSLEDLLTILKRIDAASAAGRMMMPMVGPFAEF